jgi:hypothetical protein
MCFAILCATVPANDIGEGLYADGEVGWRLRGTLDLTMANYLDRAPAALPRTGDVHLNLEELRFCDAGTHRRRRTAATERPAPAAPRPAIAAAAHADRLARRPSRSATRRP